MLLCSNETQWTRAELAQRLGAVGIHVTEDDIFSPAPVCVQYLKEHNRRPFLLVHPSSRKDYNGLDCSHPNAVVLGDAAEEFTYENLNEAFRILINADDPVLIALGMGWVTREAYSFSSLIPHLLSLFSHLSPHSLSHPSPHPCLIPRLTPHLHPSSSPLTLTPHPYPPLLTPHPLLCTQSLLS